MRSILRLDIESNSFEIFSVLPGRYSIMDSSAKNI
jgi:hypothetical protein